MKNTFSFQGILPISILRDLSVREKRHMHSRRYHGFIIKLQGATEYYTDKQHWLLSAGQILFVEKGSSYYIREITPGFSYVVNFELPVSQAVPIAKLSLPAGFDITLPAEKLYHHWQKGRPYTALSGLYDILDKADADSYISPHVKGILTPVTDYLKLHLTDPDLDIAILPRLAGISDAYLRRMFKKQYGVSPLGYITQHRIQLAEHLLLSNETMHVAQVAEAVGYRDALYFSRLFRKQLGLSPTDYRKLHIQDLF